MPKIDFPHQQNSRTPFLSYILVWSLFAWNVDSDHELNSTTLFSQISVADKGIDDGKLKQTVVAFGCKNFTLIILSRNPLPHFPYHSHQKNKNILCQQRGLQSQAHAAICSFYRNVLRKSTLSFVEFFFNYPLTWECFVKLGLPLLFKFCLTYSVT